MNTIKVICTETVKRKVTIELSVEDEVMPSRFTPEELESLAEPKIEDHVVCNSWEEEVLETEYTLGK